MIIKIILLVVKPVQHFFFLQFRRFPDQHPPVAAPGIVAEIADDPVMLGIYMNVMDQGGQLFRTGNFKPFEGLLEKASGPGLLNINRLGVTCKETLKRPADGIAPVTGFTRG